MPVLRDAYGTEYIPNTQARNIGISQDAVGRQIMALENLIIQDQVDGSAVNINFWAQSTSTFTITQSAGTIRLNSALSAATSSYAIISSVKSVAMSADAATTIYFSATVNTVPETNATMELGIGSVATTSAPTDGVFFRWANDGTFKGIVNFGGTEVTTAPLTAPSINVQHAFFIVIEETSCAFFMDGVFLGLAFPTTPFPVSNTRLPLFCRTYTAGSAPATAPQIQIGRATVQTSAAYEARPWNQYNVVNGRGWYQSPVTAFAQTTNHANSTDPTSATLSNTAAGYTTLGGRYQFAAVGGAATDFALFAYQVPAGYQLFIDSITISLVNTGAAVATTASIFDWSLGLNSSAVSLATVDGSGTWAPRRVPLGMQCFAVGAAIGVAASDLSRQFTTPVVVDGGRYLHVIVECPVGTATGSEIFRGDVVISGYFE